MPNFIDPQTEGVQKNSEPVASGQSPSQFFQGGDSSDNLEQN